MKAPFLKGMGDRNFHVTLLYASFASLFLLLCVEEKLVADFANGKWQSLLTRIALISLVGLLIVWRIEVPKQFRLLKEQQNQRNLLIVVLFLGTIFYPFAANISFLTKSVSDVVEEITKNRGGRFDKLAALLHEFPSMYEAHIEHWLPLPQNYIHLNALVKIYGLGVSPNKNVAYGKNGFFFEGWGARRVEKGVTEDFDNIADYMGQIPFSSEELRRWKRILEERYYWLREREIDYVFVLAPTKAMVYPENLPDNLQKVEKGLTRYEQLSGFLKNSSRLPFVDLLPALLAAKERQAYPLLFYKTDFHWNFYGAFIAYQTITDQVSDIFPAYSFAHPQLSEFELSIDRKWAHHRFMDMVGLPLWLHRNEHYIKMIPKPGGRYDSALDVPPGGIHDVYPPQKILTGEDGSTLQIRLIRNPDAPLRSLLLLGDSFLEKCVYFFSADAQRVLNARTVVNFPEHIFNYENPDIVIQEILNMFILREVPENPAGFHSSYLRGKFLDHQEHRTVRQKQFTRLHQISDEEITWEVKLSDLPPTVTGEVRVARITFAAEDQCGADIRLYDTNDRLFDFASNDIHAEGRQLFLELPAVESMGRVVIAVPTHRGKRCAPEKLEIRSDLPLVKSSQ